MLGILAMVLLGNITGILLGNIAGIIVLSAMVCLASLIIIKCIWHQKIRAWYLIMPLFMIVSFAMVLKAQSKIQVRSDTNYQIEGKINKVVEKQDYKQIYMYSPQISDGCNQYKLRGIIINYNGSCEVVCGMHILADISIKEYENARNPGNFDRKKYYASMNIDYYSWTDEIVITKKAPRFYEVLFGLKSKLTKVYNNIATGEDAGIYSSIVLGDKSFLDEGIRSLYQSGGMGHILAISGLHIAILGMGLYKLLRKLLVPFLPGFIICFAVINAYGIMTGNSISTIRAVIMFLMNVFAAVLGRKYDILSSLSLSAVVLLLVYPQIVYNSGFWLSFLAVAGITLIKPMFDTIFGDKRNWFLDALGASLSVNIATFPVILVSYYEIPVYSVLLNIIILPLMSLLMISVVLGGFFGMLWLPAGVFCVGMAHYILVLYEAVCRFFLNLPFSVLVIGSPAKIQIVIYIIIVAAAVMFCSNFKWKSLMLIFASFVILCVRIPKEFQTVMLDVGQGDCIHISSGGVNMLIDGGSSDVNEVGEYRIIPYLKSQGISELDYVVMTHGDNDHVNGITELMADSQIGIKNLIMPYLSVKTENYIKVEQAALANEIPISYILAGMKFTCGKAAVRCLHPADGYIYSSENEYSTVLKVTYGELDMLFTGDLDNAAEEYLLRHKVFDDIDLLKAAHHGSGYSTSSKFLECIQPEVTLISCGRNNRYGHPHPDTLQRLEAAGSVVFTTPECGAIIIEAGRKVRINGFLKREEASAKRVF